MVKDNLLKIQLRIAAVCSKTSRDPSSITIVGATKNRTLAEMQELLSCRIYEIGESRVQESILKYNNLRIGLGAKIKWHFIGRLQTNKVKDAVKIFDLIQSVDSLRLAREIDKQAARINKIQDILLEVKTSPEVTKSGLKPDAAIGITQEITALKNIRLQGLMTIAPLVDDVEEARPFFRILKELGERINQLTSQHLSVLSMGMSDDFEIAIEEGSNMVRLGRSIFEV